MTEDLFTMSFFTIHDEMIIELKPNGISVSELMDLILKMGILPVKPSRIELLLEDEDE